MLRSLKERCILYKNGKEWSVKNGKECDAQPCNNYSTVRHYRDFATLVLSTTFVAADLLSMYSIVRMLLHFFTSTVQCVLHRLQSTSHYLCCLVRRKFLDLLQKCFTSIWIFNNKLLLKQFCTLSKNIFRVSQTGGMQSSSFVKCRAFQNRKHIFSLNFFLLIQAVQLRSFSINIYEQCLKIFHFSAPLFHTNLFCKAQLNVDFVRVQDRLVYFSITIWRIFTQYSTQIITHIYSRIYYLVSATTSKILQQKILQ